MVDVILQIIDRILVSRRHGETVRRTGKSTESAIAAERHINIIEISSQLDRRPIRSKNLGLFLPALFALERNALGRAYARALRASDAIFDFVRQPRTGTL